MQLQLKIVTDGTIDGTKLVDAATGETVEVVGARVHGCIRHNQNPKQPSDVIHYVVVEYSNIEVDVEEEAAKTPFEMVGLLCRPKA